MPGPTRPQDHNDRDEDKTNAERPADTGVKSGVDMQRDSCWWPCVCVCVSVCNWLSFNVAPWWGVTDIKGSIKRGKWGGARTTTFSSRGIKQVMSSALSTNTPALSIFYFSYIAFCFFSTSVSTTKNVGTTKTYFLCGPWWRSLSSVIAVTYLPWATSLHCSTWTDF